MKRTIRFLTQLYPSIWRKRYGAEFDALLEDTKLSAHDVFDIFWGALKMQVTTSSFGSVSSDQPRKVVHMAEITIRISDRALKVAGVVLGALFLLWGFSHLWLSGGFRPKYPIQMFVPEVEGLHVGAPVKLEGISIGTVSRVEIASSSADSNRRILVVLRIEKRFQNLIREDSNGSLVRDGFLGERIVNIQRGFSGPPIDAGGDIRVVPAKEINFRTTQ